MVLWPLRRVSEEVVIQRAAAEGVRVYGISGYYLKKNPRTGIMLRCLRMTEEQIREGIRRLSRVL